MTKRAMKYRFYPTTEQETLLAQSFGGVRFVYNQILRWRTDAFYLRQENIGYIQANAELTRSAFSYRDGKLYIAKCKEPLNIRWSRELSSEPSTVTLSRDCAGRYFVSMLCDFKPEVLHVTRNTIGLDVGIENQLITDSGVKIGNPRHTAKYATRLAKAQRCLSRKKLGSANRAKAKGKIATRNNVAGMFCVFLFKGWNSKKLGYG
ncbi:MAG: helix-turn-helix domain-containing protein [Hahellaceae bacterium]|nr:helix-turn-helix domain-containing protein [Hahellaceae bacterium]